MSGSCLACLLVATASTADVRSSTTTGFEQAQAEAALRRNSPFNRARDRGTESSVPEEDSSVPNDDRVRESRVERQPNLDLGRLILELPQHFLELATVPFMPILVAMERYHVIDRVFELLTNDEKTFAVLPYFDPIFNASGIGGGFIAVYNDPLASPDRLIVQGTLRENWDRRLSINFQRRVPILSGREVGISASYHSDHDQRYFGIGGDSDRDIQRLIRSDGAQIQISSQILNPSTLPDMNASVVVGYRHLRLATGEGERAPGLTALDVLQAPAGFGRALDFPELGLTFVYDTRDSGGRTTKGFFAGSKLSFTQDLNADVDTNALAAELKLGGWIPVLPRNRVIFLTAGIAAALPAFVGDRPPLHTLVNLGGGNTLRGYVNDRFQDRLGWWATAEYRWAFYEYGGKSMGMSAAVCGVLGKVGGELEELVKGKLPWSVGYNLRLEQNLVLLGRIQFAYSPEGFRFSIGAGDLL